MKIVGILLLDIVIVYIGFTKTSQYKNKIKIQQRIYMLVDDIANKIRYINQPIYQIIKDLSCDDKYSSLDFINDLYIPTGSRDKSIDSSKTLATFTVEEKTHVKDFFNSLGNSDTTGQIALCDMYKKIIKADMDYSIETYSSKGKLYKPLSIMTAVSVTIILL